MSTRFWSVVIDSADPRRLAQWWSEALGWPIEYEADDEVVIVPTGDDLDGVPGLVFVLVDDPKRGKNRVHLDLASRSIAERDGIVERLLAAGATPADIGQGDEVPWVVLADPDGNEFCVLDPHERYDRGGALAAVVVDAHDPEALAAFWVEATGRSVWYRDEEAVSLRHPRDVLPDLEFLHVDDAKQGKNRVHLDLAPRADDDQQAEVARLVALGATPTDVGQDDDVTWVVLADPEGNEFCVLRPR